MFSFVFSFKQSIAIAYKSANPECVAVVQAFDPRPHILVKASDSSSVPFRKYGFVDAIKELNPSNSLGLLDPDYKVLYFS